MNPYSDLEQALGRLSEAPPRQAGASAEARMLIAFRMRHRRSRRVWAYVGAAAACLLIALLSVLRQHGQQAVQTSSPPRLNLDDATAGFVALPYAQSDVPMEEAVIVRMDLRASELGRLGVPVPALRANRKISTELLVGQDGVARAVRLMQ